MCLKGMWNFFKINTGETKFYVNNISETVSKFTSLLTLKLNSSNVMFVIR